MFIVKKQKGQVYSLPTKELTPLQFKCMGSSLAQQILKLLCEQPLYPHDIAKKLKVHEQKVYYHIRKLQQAGIITVDKTSSGKNTQYFILDQPSFFTSFTEFEQTSSLGAMSNESSFLEPFVKNGQLNARLIVGSPDPHGPDKARSRDGYYGMDLALFLGSFLTTVPQSQVKLDTEVQDKDLNNHLILIGGPIVNKITAKVNAKLPIRFEKGSIYSAITKERYPQDECGMIVKSKNPLHKEKMMLLVAGKRFAGTKAAILAFLRHFEKLQQPNFTDHKTLAHVVEGVDLDSDGHVDDCEFRE